MNGCFFTDHKRYHNLASLTRDKKKHCSDTYICMSTICFMLITVNVSYLACMVI